MIRVRLVSLLAVGLCVMWPMVGQGQQGRAGAPASAVVDHDVITALDKMGAYLRTLTAFQIHSTTSVEDVLDDGQKVASDGVVDMLVQRPNKLRAEVSTDLQNRMYFFDGKTFTLFARRLNYYATVPAPATLSELADTLNAKFGIELPLVDLFYWGTEKDKARNLRGAMDAGPSQVNGVTCQHYVFRQEGVDWQLWIQNGSYPLPRKFVVTTMTDPARPQYTSVMDWNLAPSLSDDAFTFTAPHDAQKIVLAEVKSGGGMPEER